MWVIVKRAHLDVLFRTLDNDPKGLEIVLLHHSIRFARQGWPDFPKHTVLLPTRSGVEHHLTGHTGLFVRAGVYVCR